MIAAVIFDMDGLMFDTEALNMKGWMEAGRRHGYEMTEEVVYGHIGANLATTRRLMTEHFGPGFDFDAVRADRVAWSFAQIEQNGMPEKPGLRELLAWLRGKALRTAIATSSERRFVDFYLGHADLGHSFDAIVSGDRVARSKPAPDIFLQAASELCATPADCVVLEDSYNGIKAAHAAGMRPVMVPDLLPPTPEVEGLLYRRVDSLSGVIPILEALHA
ncbi:MAG: HAD family phosphatase [Fretibacterium sp.]|nr:HAD family phosphatase [Fretibacterium sp.]